MTRPVFLDTLDTEGFQGLYTFVYLPMNFQKGVGLGYAIVNFAEATSAAAAALRLSSVELGGKKLQANISVEKQSLSDLICRYRDSAVMHSSVPDDCKPILFSDGLVMPFPEPTKTLEPPVHTKATRNARRSAR
jgi:RNA recognition motif-containing protein